MPIEQLGVFLARAEEPYDLIIGSRQIEGAVRVGEPTSRHVIGRVFNWAVRRLAVGGFQDTQCGYKLFTADAANRLFRLQRTNGFAFDAEVLYIAVKSRMSILELPIEWHYREGSKVRPVIDSGLMLKDTAAIRLRDAMGRYRS